jgi:CubicO group peptidase (beta-lactamase class C family)
MRTSTLRPAGALIVLVALAGACPVAASAQGGAISSEQARAIDAVFAEYDRADSPGCIVGVGQAGAIVYRNAYGIADLEHDLPLTPFMISEIGSVSKQFTAAAVVLLAQDGKLSLDDEVRKHYPEFPDFGARITIRHLLNHTSGLRDQFGLLELVGRPNGQVVTTVPEVVDLALRQRSLNFPPGSEYLYSNTGFTFLNALVERVSGKTFAAFTKERIFTPLGMNDTQWRDDYTRVVRGRVFAYRPDDKGGHQTEMPFSNLHGSGGLLTTVRDMIVWTEALHADRVGKPGFLAELTRRGKLNDGRELTYALGISVSDSRGVREVSHGGSTAGYRAHLTHFPDARLTVAVQCNVSTANAAALARGVATPFLAERVPAVVAAPSPVALAAGELERRAGLYHNSTTHQLVRLAPREDRLAGGGFELIPTGADRFVRAGEAGVAYMYVAAAASRPAELRPDDGSGVLVAVQAATPTTADLAGLAGSYHNADLDAIVTLAVENGKLVMRYPPARVVTFEPAFRDAFSAGGTLIVFRRQGSSPPSGFEYHAGRVRGIAFERR